MAQADNNKKLPKREILSTLKEFNAVLKNGKVVSSRSFSVYYTKGPNRKIAFLVPKNVAPKAVMRNRVKRYLREIYRNNKEYFAHNYWYIVQARTLAIEKLLKELESEMLELLTKIDNKNDKNTVVCGTELDVDKKYSERTE
ncbi:MAG: ribonuclease P protein component [candidate division WOR-3 bacterium]|nr:ribonuclease P protein component [candidate division WOR-3 bacterium]